jgi:hypothetical protein
MEYGDAVLFIEPIPQPLLRCLSSLLALRTIILFYDKTNFCDQELKTARNN